MVIKVFITVERDDKPTKNDDMIISECMKLESKLTLNKVPCQIKVTSLPRLKGFRKASELLDIERR